MRSMLQWGLLIALCVLIQGIIFGIGFLTGAVIGESGSGLTAFTEIEVLEGCDGSLSLGGEVQTPADLDRLQSQVIRALGESRSVEVMRPVHVKQ